MLTTKAPFSGLATWSPTRMAMKPENTVFAFFPYLVTRERFHIRRIQFRSTLDTADVPADIKAHLLIRR
jgi:hypothetical protein